MHTYEYHYWWIPLEYDIILTVRQQISGEREYKTGSEDFFFGFLHNLNFTNRSFNIIFKSIIPFASCRKKPSFNLFKISSLLSLHDSGCYGWKITNLRQHFLFEVGFWRSPKAKLCGRNYIFDGKNLGVKYYLLLCFFLFIFIAALKSLKICKINPLNITSINLTER